MTFDEFIKANKRKRTDDLISEFMKYVVGVTPFHVDCPKNYFIRFEHYEELAENFIKISNTPEFIPEKGDLCVWGSGVCNGKGAAFLATGKGNEKHFYCAYINRRGKMNKKRCNYKYFLGVLRAD